MPRRKNEIPRSRHWVELTIQSMHDGVDVMSEQVAVLHNEARKKDGAAATEARRYADQIAESVRDIRESLVELEKRLKTTTLNPAK